MRTRWIADRHARLVGSFDGAGLWFFIFFPFWSTGVINGAALDFLLGLRARVIIGGISSSHLVSLVTLLGFFESLSGFMDTRRMEGEWAATGREKYVRVRFPTP